MKSFKQYITEDDIELVSLRRTSIPRDLRISQNEFSYGRKKNLGNIHPEYSLHKSGGDFFIRHDKSNSIVGHISNDAPHKSRSLEVSMTAVHPDHTTKKIGHSLAFAAYKHLWNQGYTIKSGSEQSFGGHDVWGGKKGLMNDPMTRKYVHAVSTNRGRRSQLGLAYRLPASDIWTSDDYRTRRKAIARGIAIDSTKRDGWSGDRKADGVHLELRPKKQKK
jgi:hypothetical protein